MIPGFSGHTMALLLIPQPIMDNRQNFEQPLSTEGHPPVHHVACHREHHAYNCAFDRPCCLSPSIFFKESDFCLWLRIRKKTPRRESKNDKSKEYLLA